MFAKKKDGGLRLCVDYRGLNQITLHNRYIVWEWRKYLRSSIFAMRTIKYGWLQNKSGKLPFGRNMAYTNIWD
jgi:hypothetical protein